MLHSNPKKKIKPIIYFVKILQHFWFSTLSVLLVLILRGASTILVPRLTSNLIGVISAGSYSIWPTVLQLILVTLLVHLAYRFLLYAYFIRDEVRIHAKVIADGLERALIKNQKYFETYSPGLLLTKITDLHLGVQEMHMSLQYWLLPSALVLVIVSVDLLFISPALSFLILQPLIVTLVAVLYLWPCLRDREQEYVKLYSRVSAKLNDVLSNSLCVRLFNGLQYQLTSQKNTFNKLRRANAKLNWIYFVLFTIYDISIVGVLLGQFYILIRQLKNGRISVESFSSIIIQTGILQSTLWQIVIGIPELLLNYSKLKEAMLVIWDGEQEKSGKDLVVTEGKIEYKEISFGYNDINLFNDLSITISPGEMVGLVGKSGAGKSSFINLLLGLYTQNHGSIKIDGQDLNEISTSSIRKQVGIIPQQPLLFNDSIYNNIKYGKFDASEEEIINAAKVANLHDVVVTLTDGYQSSTSTLSGGQQQRVSIARAVLKNPRILVLDEATSQLDSITERSVQEAIENMRTGRTIIVIAHRLSTLISCDRILVFNNGQIVETGTHEELMKLNKEYATLYNTQHLPK